MNTIDYFSQPDELYRPVYCTLHVVLSPKNFGISRALVRLSGHSRETLAAVFQDPPKSLRIELRRLKRLRRYLNGCGCFYQVSFDSPVYESYAGATGRNDCAAVLPLWSELSLDGY